ncbi:phosphonate C-P lyase system protein PhnG [Bacillus sp. FJAT-49705]|uniref:Phosphonate C-P lyase system protein PhnG n=1 Tax=Cytobacillus citreus TaxID=2833586 RepID=A0ABS5NXJ5_9BACI|nr:phosphonate C-P lyase system protein PhnG [Cytobacillus citreus]MBS4192564.1 phosphonate C-P lyase system protein PhnG [Cytobacillus citreus]
MKRKRRTEILINSPDELAEELAKEIEQIYLLKVVQEPENGLVMLKVRETAKKSLFYLGEVFVTECKVKIQDSIGIGIVKGDKPKLAYYLAIIDAAYGASLRETRAWTSILEEKEKELLEQKIAHNQEILKTKVSFETMDVS